MQWISSSCGLADGEVPRPYGGLAESSHTRWFCCLGMVCSLIGAGWRPAVWFGAPAPLCALYNTDNHTTLTYGTQCLRTRVQTPGSSKRDRRPARGLVATLAFPVQNAHNNMRGQAHLLATGRHHVVSHPSGVGRILRSHPPHPPSGFAYLPFPTSQSPPSQRARPAAEESRMDRTEKCEGQGKRTDRQRAPTSGAKLYTTLGHHPLQRTQTYLPIGRT